MSRGPESPTIKLPHFPTIYPPSTPKKSLFLLPCSSLVLFSRSKMPSTLPAASGTWQAGVWDREQPAMKWDPHSRDTHPKPSITCCHPKHRKGDTEVSPNVLAMVAWNSSTFCQCLPPKPTHFSTSGLLLSVAKLLVSGLCCEQDERANAAMKANFATKILEFFFTGDYIKNWQFSHPLQFGSSTKLLEWR